MNWEKQEKYKQQPSLFELDEAEDESSKADKIRFDLIRLFDLRCKKLKLGVSIHTNCCLWTPDKNNPINFWNYEPQHEMDKAPMKQTKRP